MPDVQKGTRTDGQIGGEQAFYDELAVEGSKTRTLLDCFSESFYDKGPRGRLWGPVWRSVDLNGKTVLDYVCGDGRFTHTLARLGARATGIDISPQLIAKAKATAPRETRGSSEFFVGDAHSVPFGDSSFDYVFGNGSLHHLELGRAYAEVARVLKPGGIAFFHEPMFYHPLLRIVRGLTPKLRSPNERPLSFAEIEQARQYFRKVSHREHFLLAVLAAPAHLLGRNIALRAVGIVDRVDQALMWLVPPLRKLAWLTVIQAEK